MGLVYDADSAIYKFGLLAFSNAHNVTWHRYSDSQVTDAAVCALGSNCPRLKSVNLSSCVQITDAGIIAIARRCPLLVDIDCGHCGLSPCLASCGNGMKGCPRPVWGCSKATSSSLRPRLKNCNRYNNEVNNRVYIFELGFIILCFAGTLLSSAAVIALAEGCRGLRRVCFAECVGVTDDAVKALARNCSLVEIDVFDCQQLTDESMVPLAEG